MGKISTELSASSEEMRAEFAKAAAVVKNLREEVESQGQRTLQLARAEVEALRLEARGHEESAAALRRKITLAEEARKMAAATGISEENALRILQRKTQLEEQLATARAKGAAAARARQADAAARQKRIENPRAAGISLPGMPLTPQTLAATEKAAARTTAGLAALTRAERNAGNGMMQLAYFVDDAQYGMKGISNNIPAVVQAFGGTGGLAGAIGIAAIGLFTYYKLARLVFKQDQIDAYYKALTAGEKAWADQWKESRRNLAKDNAARQLARDMEDWMTQANQLHAQRLAVQDQILLGMEKENQLRREARALEDDLAAARNTVTEAKGGVVDPAAKRNDAMRRLEEDRKAAEEESRRAQAEAMRLGAESATRAMDYAADKKTREEEMAALRDVLTGSEANVAQYQKLVESLQEKGSTKDKLNAQASLDAALKRKDAIEAQLRELEAAADAAKSVEETRKALAEKNISGMDDRTKEAYERAAALAKEIPIRKEINRLAAEAEGIRQGKSAADWSRDLEIQRALAKQDLERVRALERQREIEEEKLRIMKEQGVQDEKAAEKKAAEMVDAKREAAVADARLQSQREAAVLAARASGDRAMVRKLEREAELEKLKLEIMRSQNRTAAEAARMAENILSLRRQAASLETKRDFTAEMKALRLEAAGDKRGADALRREEKIRKEAEALAQGADIPEARALALVREKYRLEEQITRMRKRESGRGRIYMKRDGDERLSPARIGGLRGSVGGLRGSVGGLGQKARKDDARSSRAPKRDAAREAAEKYYERSIAQGDQLLAIWKTIGVY